VEPQGLMAFVSNTDKLYSSCMITVLYKCWLVFMQALVLVESDTLTRSVACYKLGLPRRQSHCRSGLATLPSVGAIP